MMRYVLVKGFKNYKVVDITKGGLTQQGLYVTDNDGVIVGNVISSYDDPLEALSDLMELNCKVLRKQIKEEVRNERY